MSILKALEVMEMLDVSGLNIWTNVKVGQADKKCVDDLEDQLWSILKKSKEHRETIFDQSLLLLDFDVFFKIPESMFFLNIFSDLAFNSIIFFILVIVIPFSNECLYDKPMDQVLQSLSSFLIFII
jgi:hypothetical protein